MLSRTLLQCAFFLTAFLISMSALAQKQFGSLRGTIEDSDGEPVPGVFVTAANQLHGSSVAYTDEAGHYRIDPMIPGVYEVSAELANFQKVINSGIRISVGNTSIVDFVLHPEAIGESIDVQSGTPLIDSTTAAIWHPVQPEMIQGLPEKHFRELLSLTPGVGDDLVAYGASITSNRIWIDGIDISSGSNGGLFVDYNYNWMEEVQVVGNGAPAEFGNYSGVIGNYAIRSGGNQFHGLFETFFHNENLQSTNFPDPDPLDFQSWDVSAQIGGPIQRDRLWFFSGFQYPYIQDTPFGYEGVRTNEHPKFVTKLTYKPNQNNTIQGFAHFNHLRIDGDGADSPIFDVLPEATSVSTCNDSSWNATWISVLTPSSTLEGRFGGLSGSCDFAPRNNDAPARIHFNSGVHSGNATHTIRHRRFQPQGNVTFSHYTQDFLGSHDFKFGTQIQAYDIDHRESINGGFIYYDFYNVVQNYRIADLQDTLKYDGNIDQLSLFVQDTWHFSRRITLNLGLRWDNNRGSTERGVVHSANAVTPRVGLIWNVREERPIVIKVHFGDYSDALLLRQFVFLSDEAFGYEKQTFDQETQQWQTQYRERNLFLYDPDTKHPFVRQFTAGFDHELPAGIVAGAHYIYRKWHNILEDVDANSMYQPISIINPITGEPVTVYSRMPAEEIQTILTNPDGLYRKYDGFEAYANRRFTNDFAISASFVYSKTRGNIPNTRELFNSGFTPFLNDPNSLINFNGRLVNDPTFAWKVAGTYRFRYGLNFGWFYRHQTGDTWEPLVNIAQYVNQGGRIFGLPRGSFRLPSQDIVDLRVEKQFHMFHGQFRVTADVFNIFNDGTATAVDARWERRATYGKPIAFVQPRTIRLALRYTF